MPRSYWYCENVNQPSGGEYDGEEAEVDETYHLATEETANLISSLTGAGKHRPVFDIDFPVYCVPSSTEGHYHLYIEKDISWHQLYKILMAFRAAKIIQEGWFQGCVKRGFASVRPPWLKKGQKPKEPWKPVEAKVITDKQASDLYKLISLPEGKKPMAPFTLEHKSAWFKIDGGAVPTYMDHHGWVWPLPLLQYHGVELPPVEIEEEEVPF